MAIDHNKSFTVSGDGITVDQGSTVWIGGGDGVPTHNAPQGSRYFRTTPVEFYEQQGPGETNNWQLFSNGAGVGTTTTTFWNDGGAADKWLRRQNHHTQASGPSTKSEVEPFVFCFDGEVQGYSYVSKDEDGDLDIEIYKNGTLQTTWNIRNRKWECDTSITAVSFSAGDKLSIFSKKFSGGTGDDNPDDVLLDIFIAFTDDTAQKLGGSTL